MEECFLRRLTFATTVLAHLWPSSWAVRSTVADSFTEAAGTREFTRDLRVWAIRLVVAKCVLVRV